jgi:hypothetical protein
VPQQIYLTLTTMQSCNELTPLKLKIIPISVSSKELPYCNADRGKLSYMERMLNGQSKYFIPLSIIFIVQQIK